MAVIVVTAARVGFGVVAQGRCFPVVSESSFVVLVDAEAVLVKLTKVEVAL